jgi:hypothetical protein
MTVVMLVLGLAVGSVIGAYLSEQIKALIASVKGIP